MHFHLYKTYRPTFYFSTLFLKLLPFHVGIKELNEKDSFRNCKDQVRQSDMDSTPPRD